MNKDTRWFRRSTDRSLSKTAIISAFDKSGTVELSREAQSLSAVVDHCEEQAIPYVIVARPGSKYRISKIDSGAQAISARLEEDAVTGDELLSEEIGIMECGCEGTNCPIQLRVTLASNRGKKIKMQLIGKTDRFYLQSADHIERLIKLLQEAKTYV